MKKWETVLFFFSGNGNLMELETCVGLKRKKIKMARKRDIPNKVLNDLIPSLLLIWHYGGNVSGWEWNDVTCWRSSLLTHADVTPEFLRENAERALACWATAAQYLWLITLHATATVKHRSEEDIGFMGVENCRVGGLKNRDVTWQQVQRGHFLSNKVPFLL